MRNISVHIKRFFSKKTRRTEEDNDEVIVVEAEILERVGTKSPEEQRRVAAKQAEAARRERVRVENLAQKVVNAVVDGWDSSTVN